MRYAGAGANRNTFEPSNGLTDARITGAPAFASDPGAAGLTRAPDAAVCIDASTTSLAGLKACATAGLSVARVRVGFVTLAAICRSGDTLSRIQNARPIVDATTSP